MAIQSKDRLGILDCLNHPWIKNEKLNENQILKIFNKQKAKKSKINNGLIEENSNLL